MSELKDYDSGYRAGYLQALYDYAWWKDGVMYVGGGIKTYEEAKMLAEIKIEEFLESFEDK